MLFELFNGVATVMGVRIVRRPASSIAYLHLLHGARQALEALRFTTIGGCVVNIGLVRSHYPHNVRCSNLPPSLHPRALHDAFRCYGSIDSCTIKGHYGYVSFWCKDAMDACLRGTMTIQGFVVVVEPSTEQRIYLSNVHGDRWILDVQRFGGYRRCTRHKNHAIVTFATREDALRCLDALQGSSLHASLARPRNANVFVPTVDDEVDDQTLRSIFGEYGRIHSMRRTGKGSAFVCFETEAEAREAVDGTKLHYLRGKPLRTRLLA